MKALNVQLAARNAKLSQLLAKHMRLTDELNRVNLKSMAGATESNILESVAEAWRRPANCAKVTLQCRNTSAMPSTTAFALLLTKRADFRCSCETRNLESQRIPRLITEAKEPCERVAKQ